MLVLPFLDDRSQDHVRWHWRMHYALSRNPDGSIAYFGGRENNGGDATSAKQTLRIHGRYARRG